jgi:hypothetical protein
LIWPLIGARLHGWLDDGVVLLYLGGAYFLHLHGDGLTFAIFGASVHFALARLTNYPQGQIKWIPFRVHAFIELGDGIIIGTCGYLLAHLDQISAGAFLEVMGASQIGAFLFSDYRWPLPDKVSSAAGSHTTF